MKMMDVIGKQILWADSHPQEDDDWENSGTIMGFIHTGYYQVDDDGVIHDVSLDTPHIIMDWSEDISKPLIFTADDLQEEEDDCWKDHEFPKLRGNARKLAEAVWGASYLDQRGISDECGWDYDENGNKRIKKLVDSINMNYPGMIATRKPAGGNKTYFWTGRYNVT